MQTIGITGGIASGKSSVLELFSRWGALVIDSDAVSRRCSRPGTDGYREIVEAFGPGVLAADGQIERAALAAEVAADAQKKQRLERILHPRIMAHILAELEKARRSGAPIVFVEVPLLFEAGLERSFDRTVSVIAPPALQLERLARRPGMSEAQARLWLANQWPQEKKAELADFVLRNEGTMEELHEKAKALYQELLRESEERKNAHPAVH